jgi:hypothetical protein
MRVRKTGLFTVTIGALALSFTGQIRAVSPLLGERMGIVLALTNDLATILALAEATARGASASVRRWAWAVMFLAGGTALGLNTWHAVASAALPVAAAVAVGAGPVVLAWLLSHLVTLVIADRSTEVAVIAAHPDAPPEALPAGERQRKQRIPETDLVAQAEELDAAHHDEHGRGISYRAAARELGVRFDRAKQALLVVRGEEPRDNTAAAA